MTGQVQLGIFSNNGHWLHQHAERIVPELMPLFRTRLVCSGSIGLRKPDPAAFLLCLERLGFSAATTLFVDDKPANADGARQAAWHLNQRRTHDSAGALRSRDGNAAPRRLPCMVHPWRTHS